MEFANSEIERLRAKLVVDDEDMPALVDELMGQSKTNMLASLKRDHSADINMGPS